MRKIADFFMGLVAAALITTGEIWGMSFEDE